MYNNSTQLRTRRGIRSLFVGRSGSAPFGLSVLSFLLVFLLMGSKVNAQWCTPSGGQDLYYNNYGYEFGITGVSYSTVANTGNGVPTSSTYFYSDYSSLSGSIEQGTTVNMTVDVGSSQSNFGGAIRVWVDWDNNGTFSNSEDIYSDYCSYTSQYTVPIAVSNSQSLGNYRMRIMSGYGYYFCYYGSIYNACNGQQTYYFDISECEDYTIQVIAASNMAWNSDATTQNTAPISGGTSDNPVICLNVQTTGSLSPLTLDNITANMVGSTLGSDITSMKVYYTGLSSSFSNSNLVGSISNPGNSSSYTITPSSTLSLGAGNNYFWVTADISSNPTIGDLIDAQVTAYTLSGTGYTPATTSPAGSRKIDYCVPVYTGGCDNGYLAISNVQLDACSNSLNNNSGWSCSSAISDYTSLPAPALEQGSNNNLVVTQTYSPGLVSAWIDFDQNGDFYGSGEYLGSYAVYNWNYYQSGTINFNVPNGASTGNTRMRIRTTWVYYMNNGYDPCNTENYGETEDYTVNITASSNQTYNSSSTFQANTGNALLNTNDQEVLKIQVSTCGSNNPLNLTSANFDLSSCSNLADITNAKLYYTGNSNTFNTSTLVGSTSSISNSISITGSLSLASGVNNFWLAFDVPSTATLGDQLCASCTNINVGGNNYTPSGGTQCRTIDYCAVTPPYYGYWNMINSITIDGNTQYPYCYNYYCNYSGSIIFYGEQGASVQLDGSTTYGYDGVYIDWDNNGDFYGSGEMVYYGFSTWPSYAYATSTINIPNTAAVGDHRMRVVHSYYTYPDPCGFSNQYTYAQAVDMTFHVNPSSNMVLNWINADQPNTSNCQIAGDQDILRVNLNTTGSLSPLSASNFAFNTNGTTNTGDIVTAKLYYTGISSTFSTGNLVGSYSGPSGSFTITPSATLGNGNNYFWLAYDIGSGSANDQFDAEISTVDVTSYGSVSSMTSAPAGYRVLDYCTVNPWWYPYYNIISDITVGTTTKSYQYYSSYQNSTSDVYTVEQGMSYTFSASTSSWSGNMTIWADLNDDLDFNDAGETILSGYAGWPSNAISGVYMVPLTAPVGDHRMRIGIDIYNSASPCGAYGYYQYYGQVLDVTLHVNAATNMVLNSVDVNQASTNSVVKGSNDNEIISLKLNTSGALSPLTLNSFSFSMSGTTNTSDVSNISVYSTGGSNTFSNSNLVGTISPGSGTLSFSNAQTLVGGDNYFWIAYDVASGATLGNKVDALVSNVTVNSSSVSFNDASNPGDRKIWYCTPTYFYPGNITMTNVTFNTINNNSTGSSNYEDFSSISTTCDQGATYNFSATTYSWGYQPTFVWIDFNDDGVFSGSEQVLFDYRYYTTDYTYYSNNTTITIPNSANVGTHIMRVAANTNWYNYYGDPCGNDYYGQTEDYTVVIQTPQPKSISAITVTQYSSAPVQPGSTDNGILLVKVDVTGSTGTMPFNSLTITDASSNPGDVTSVGVWESTDATLDYYDNYPAYGPLSGGTFTATNINSDLPPGTTYYILTYDISSSATLGETFDQKIMANDMTFNSVTYNASTDDPAGFRKIGYCQPTSVYSGNYYISQFQLGSVISQSNTNASSWIDYTSVSGTVEQGVSYNMTISNGWYSYAYNTVWVDYNDNGIFDSGEELLNNYASYGTVYTTVTIPAAANIGTHTMRVLSVYGWWSNYYSAYDPCQNDYYLQAQDYTLTIIPQTPKQVNSFTVNQYSTNDVVAGSYNNPIIDVSINVLGSLNTLPLNSLKVTLNNTNNNDINGSGVTLWYSSSSDFSTAYQVGQGQVAGSGTVTWDNSNTYGYFPMDLATGNNHFFVAYDISSSAPIGDQMDAYIAANDVDINSTTYPSVNGDPVGSRPVGYCTDQYYPWSSYYGCYYVWTDGFTFNTISNTSTGCGGTNGYNNYTYLSTQVQQGNTYSMKITAGSLYGYQLRYYVWVDLNDDGVFANNSTERWLNNRLINGGASYTFNKAITNSMNLGQHRMRVRGVMSYYGSSTFGACDQTYYGETEDYTIEILPSTPDPVISPANPTICSSSSQVFTSSTAATWTTYDWYVDASLVQSGASNTYVFTGAAGSHSVYCVVTDSYSQVGTSNTANITVNQSPLVGTANISLSSVCAGDPTVLSLTSATGTIQWQSWNGSSWQNIGTGSPLTVYPTSSTSYQAVVSTTGCGSVVSNSVSVNVGGNFVWKGSVSSSWNNALNWCNGQIPNSSTAIVSIGNSSTYTYALDFSGTRTCASLTLDNGGSMTISSGTLTVMGNVDVNGTLNFANGTLKVGGVYSQAGSLNHTGGTLELQGAQAVPSNTYNKLVLSATSGTYTMSSNITANKLLQVNGTLNTGANVVKCYGDVCNSGTISGNGIELWGSTQQRLYGTADGYYSNIYDYNTFEVRQDNNTFVSGTLYINGSAYYIKGVDLTIGSTGSSAGTVITTGPGNLNHSSSPNTGTCYILGNSSAAAISGFQSQSFNGLYIDLPAGVTMGAKMLVRAALTLANGTLDMNGYNLTSGNSGSTYNTIYTSGSGQLNNSNTSAGLFTINGSTSNTLSITGLKLGSQYDFTLNRPGSNGGVTLGANATINGTAKVSNGDVNYGNYIVTISSTGKINETYGNSFIGSNSGYLVTTRNLGSLSFNNIAGLGAVVNTSTSMGNTVIKRYTNNNITPTGSGHSIKRMWLFAPSTNTGLNADIRLTYDDNSTDNLIGGNSNSGMRIFRSSNGVTWTNNGSVGFSGSAGTLRSVNSTSSNKLNALEYLTAYDPANTIRSTMLMNLVAKQNGANVNLTWSTSSEFNNSHFVVERSIDGVNYSAIGEIVAVGNSTTSTSYSYLDLNVQQLGEQFVYYRVRQVSLDNSFSYTRRALVDYNYTPEEFNVSTVMPNPFVTEVTVGFTVNTTSPVNIRLMDINGKLISEELVTLQSGYHTYTFNKVSDLAAGVYMITLNNGVSTKTVKVVKANY